MAVCSSVRRRVEVAECGLEWSSSLGLAWLAPTLLPPLVSVLAAVLARNSLTSCSFVVVVVVWKHTKCARHHPQKTSRLALRVSANQPCLLPEGKGRNGFSILRTSLGGRTRVGYKYTIKSVRSLPYFDTMSIRKLD